MLKAISAASKMKHAAENASQGDALLRLVLVMRLPPFLGVKKWRLSPLGQRACHSVVGKAYFPKGRMIPLFGW